jgi:hypothetical protein
VFSLHGYRFEGYFVNNKKDGCGLLHDAEGKTYEEIWEEGLLIARDLITTDKSSREARVMMTQGEIAALT